MSKTKKKREIHTRTDFCDWPVVYPKTKATLNVTEQFLFGAEVQEELLGLHWGFEYEYKGAHTSNICVYSQLVCIHMIFFCVFWLPLPLPLLLLLFFVYAHKECEKEKKWETKRNQRTHTNGRAHIISQRKENILTEYFSSLLIFVDYFSSCSLCAATFWLSSCMWTSTSPFRSM